MGRKPIPPGDRSVATSITLKPDIMARLIAAANRRGMSLSALIADLATKGLPGYEAPVKPVLVLNADERMIQGLMSWWAEKYPDKPFNEDMREIRPSALASLRAKTASHAKALAEYNAKMAVADAAPKPEREA